MYKVLARKYRPTKLSEIIGQDIAVKILKNAIDSNRLHHAILLAGPMGVGKTSTARIIAKSLNCEKGITSEPCNICESCVSISKGKNVDVIEIDGASNRKVDDARKIIESIKYPPLKNRYKVYIIDEIHMLTIEAFNALLKTIEEPPDYVKFIFATTAMEKVPDTILSRCQIITLKKIPKHIIKQKLKNISLLEGVDIDDKALDIIAFASFGSMRVAEGYLDRCIAYKHNNLTQADVSKVLGVTDQETLDNYFSYILHKNAISAIKILEILDEQGANFELFSQQCIKYLLDNKDISLEYKTAMLNIYYQSFIDIKQKIDALSVLNIATYKSASLSNLEKIETIIEKIQNSNLHSLNSKDILNQNNTQTQKQYSSIKEKAAFRNKPEAIGNIKNKKGYANTDELNENVKLVLREFEGKIITIEKLNK